MTDYTEINAMLASIIEGIPYTMTNLANASALLNEKLDGINWVGFYTIKDGKLVLGPFQGKVACTIIPMGKGVCGTAAEKDSTQVVPDVNEYLSFQRDCIYFLVSSSRLFSAGFQNVSCESSFGRNSCFTKCPG